MEKIYFVMPAYNESENIRETVQQWYSNVLKLNTLQDVLGGGVKLKPTSS